MIPTAKLCSRQESNLEHWYRKPVFYPLNYESSILFQKRERAEKCCFSALDYNLKSKKFQYFIEERFLKLFLW